MKDIDSIDIKRFQARAQLPRYFRVGAVVLFCAVVIALLVGFFLERPNNEFRMTGFPTELSKDVVATVNSYERREVEGGSVKYYIRADKASTFSDNHQELENVYLQLFDSEGAFNEISAAKAVYVPEETRNFAVYFAGNVNIATRYGLTLTTEQITYKSSTETATSEEAVTFERSNIKGRSFGAVLNIANRSVELQRDVRFEITQASGTTDTVASGHAVYMQNTGLVEFSGGATLNSSGGEGETIEATASRVKLTLDTENKSLNEVKKAEFFDNAKYVRALGNQITRLSAANAVYERSSDRMDLKGNVVIESLISGNLERTITGDSAFYSKRSGRAEVIGNAQAVEGPDLLKGDRIDVDLDANGEIRKAVVTGSAFMRQTRDDQTTEIGAKDLTAVFEGNSSIASASAFGQSEVKQRSSGPGGTQQLTIVATDGIDALFRPAGSFDRVKTDGRTTIKLNSPDNGHDSSDKEVSADQVVTAFNSDGRSLKRAEATGNAEFLIIPHRASITNYRVNVKAPRFECEFYSTGSDPRVCVGANSARLTRTPTVSREGRGTQVVSASMLTSRFDQAGGNIAQLDAAGKAKFTELDRNAAADSFTFSANDEIVRLRGAEPTAWDSRARFKAKEIDWDTKNSRSNHRGLVSATYYSSKGLGNAPAFGGSEKPVYVTAESAEIDHAQEVARFSGNARAWQGASYVRAETITFGQKNSGMVADGSVQSALFDTKPGGTAPVPVFVSAISMKYNGEKRIVTYNGNVLIRKGPDRISGASAIAWLNESNDMTATDIENDVAISQPGRNASADFARYTSSDEKMILRGRPAKVEDPVKGSLAGAELTIYLKDKRVYGNGPTPENPTGRIRNTYKIQ